jgi:hypothetical protein
MTKSAFSTRLALRRKHIFLGKKIYRLLLGASDGADYCPVHLLGKTAAISSSARSLRVSKTESYDLSRICFEMTRQATMLSVEGVTLSCR